MTEWTSLFPAHKAACEGDVTTLRSTLQAGPGQVNALDNDGWTPMHYAAWYGQLAAVQLLLDTPGADANAPAKETGARPLHLAAGTGRVDVVQLLLRHPGVDRTVRNTDKQTPLDLVKELRPDNAAAIIALLVQA